MGRSSAGPKDRSSRAGKKASRARPAFGNEDESPEDQEDEQEQQASITNRRGHDTPKKLSGSAHKDARNAFGNVPPAIIDRGPGTHYWHKDDADDDLDDDDDDQRASPAAQIARPEMASTLQSSEGKRQRGVFIPYWAISVTEKDDEQKFLGFLDYWLGMDGSGKVRSHYLFYCRGDKHPYLKCTARFIGKGIGKDKRQVHRLVDKMFQKGLLDVMETTDRNGGKAWAVRLNWSRIEEIYSEGDGADCDNDMN